ncbi:MAG: recombinase family protein [Pseudomonadota bacterium]
MIIGYARVSTTGQNLDAQTDAPTAAGAERLFSERVSGAKAERPELCGCFGGAIPDHSSVLPP